jgi:hypothetical protein
MTNADQCRILLRALRRDIEQAEGTLERYLERRPPGSLAEALLRRDLLRVEARMHGAVEMARACGRADIVDATEPVGEEDGR